MDMLENIKYSTQEEISSYSGTTGVNDEDPINRKQLKVRQIKGIALCPGDSAWQQSFG